MAHTYVTMLRFSEGDAYITIREKKETNEGTSVRSCYNITDNRQSFMS